MRKEEKISVPVMLIVLGAMFVLFAIFLNGTGRFAIMYIATLFALLLVGGGVWGIIKKYRLKK